MQANQLTLSVDYLNDATTTDEVYSRADFFGNRSVYHGASHSAVLRDTISLYRSGPKPNGNFRGVTKNSAKLSKDVEVAGADGVATLTVPSICEISFSLPVGITDADILKLRQRAIALLDDDTIMDMLNIQNIV
jgi:hypothetical protein